MALKPIKYQIKPTDQGGYCYATPKKIRYNNNLALQLDILINRLRTDKDVGIIIDGSEGSGKSTLAQQVGAYIAHKTKTPFTVDNIFFKTSNAIQAIKRFPRYSVILQDESYENMNKFRMSSAAYQETVVAFQKARQFNHIFILVLPNFFDLSKEFAVRRTWFLLHTYEVPRKNPKEIADVSELELDSKPVFLTGLFRFWNKRNKMLLYQWGKKGENYNVARYDFQGTFSAAYGVDKEAYLAKKREVHEEPRMDERTWIEECLRRGMGNTLIAKYSEYTRQGIWKISKVVEQSTVNKDDL